MISALCKKILKKNAQPLVCAQQLKSIQIMQQDNDPKHSSKSTSEQLRKILKRIFLQWPSQNLDLNPVKMLCYDLKPVNPCLKTLQWSLIKTNCKEELVEIPPQKDTLPDIANTWLLPRVTQPVVRFRVKLLFYRGPCQFG